MRDARADERGFSLVELMVVVVLIIGILIAIALPTFLGAKTRAADKAAPLSFLRQRRSRFRFTRTRIFC